MSKATAKKSTASAGRLLAKATFIKSKLKAPGKPAPKPAKAVKPTKAPPIALKPIKTKPEESRNGKAAVSPTRPAPVGKGAATKSTPTNAVPMKSTPIKSTPVKSTPVKASAAPVKTSAATILPASGSKKTGSTPTKSPSAPPARPVSVAKPPPAPPVIVPRPVATDGKPRKNQAGLTSKELEFYRELLLQKRRELVGDMSSMEREALRSANSNLSNQPVHMADQGTDNYEQEFTLGLVEKDRNLLREINRALSKIQDGTYGICEGTGKPISKPRLEAQPWAKYSIEYARELEKGGVRR